MELKSKSKMDRIIELANEIKEVEGALDLLRKDLQELIEDNNGGSSVKTSKDRKRWNGWAKRRMAKSMGKYWENLTDAEWDARVKKMQDARSRNMLIRKNKGQAAA